MCQPFLKNHMRMKVDGLIQYSEVSFKAAFRPLPIPESRITDNRRINNDSVKSVMFIHSKNFPLQLETVLGVFGL